MYGYFTLDSVPLGQYTVANGVSTVLGVNEVAKANPFVKVYPNPTSGSFTISLTPAQTQQYVYVYNIEGKLMLKMNIAAGQKTCMVETDKWANGVYNISLQNSTREIANTKIVVAH